MEKIRSLQKDLERRAKEHDAVATQARAAAQRLGKLLEAKHTKAATKKAAAPTQKKSASKSKPNASLSNGKAPRTAKSGPTLAQTIEKMLSSSRGKKSDRITARQLRTEVEKVGYKFAGDKFENQMNYLHKVLRSFGSRIKRAADGTVSMNKA